MEPIFSVIINSYNYGTYIDEAISSVLSQTLSSDVYELIVVDDGSEDNTRERVIRYSDKLTYLYKENGGQASALNAGLAIAKGEFVAFLDADDYWQREKLTRVLDEFIKHPAVDVVYHAMQLVNSKGEPISVFPSWFETLVSVNTIGCDHPLLMVYNSATSSMVWRRSALNAILPIPNEFIVCADTYLMTLAPLVVKQFGLLSSPLSNYRIHGRNNWADYNFERSTCEPRFPVDSRRYTDISRKYLEMRAEMLGLHNSPMLLHLRYARFKLLIDRSREIGGIISAISEIWANRVTLYQFPLRYRIFRIFNLLLSLSMKPNVYKVVREKCLKCLLCHKIIGVLVGGFRKDKYD